MKGTDILITLNTPLVIHPESSGAEDVDCPSTCAASEALETFMHFLRTFSINDWGLFGEWSLNCNWLLLPSCTQAKSRMWTWEPNVSIWGQPFASSWAVVHRSDCGAIHIRTTASRVSQRSGTPTAYLSTSYTPDVLALNKSTATDRREALPMFNWLSKCTFVMIINILRYNNVSTWGYSRWMLGLHNCSLSLGFIQT